MNLLEQFKLLRKISEVCSEPIMIEDLFLLLSIYHRNESNLDVELQHEIKYYYLQFQFYDASSDNPTLISWVKRVEYLMKLNLLEAPYGEWKKVKSGFVSVDILKLEVTNKFKKDILAKSESKRTLWEYLLSDDVWGEELYVNGEEYSNRIPAKEYHKMGYRSEEHVMDLLWKLCDYGNTIAIKKFFTTTMEYKEEFGVDRILIRYLLEYHSLEKRLKAKQTKR